MTGIFFVTFVWFNTKTILKKRKEKEGGSLSQLGGEVQTAEHAGGGFYVPSGLGAPREIPSEELEGASGHKDLRAASLSPAAF